MKTIKLLSFIIILLGSITSSSIWAAARSGGGHGGGSEHYAIGGQLAGESPTYRATNHSSQEAD